jgi:hypothetical protein
MRRVVVTPTFAAGLGVVVAAVLAYPMHTVFSYAAPNGATCRVMDCGAASPGGGEAAGAGNRLQGTAPNGSRSGARGSEAAGEPRPPAGGSGRTGSGGSPYLRYWTAYRGHGGFNGAIMIVFRHDSAPAHWRLWFGYSSARLVKVWAGRFLRHRPHSAEVTSGDLAGHAWNNRPVAIWIGVTGRSAPPQMCSFDGRPCHIFAHQQGGHGYHHGRHGSHRCRHGSRGGSWH